MHESPTDPASVILISPPPPSPAYLPVLSIVGISMLTTADPSSGFGLD